MTVDFTPEELKAITAQLTTAGFVGSFVTEDAALKSALQKCQNAYYERTRRPDPRNSMRRAITIKQFDGENIDVKYDFYRFMNPGEIEQLKEQLEAGYNDGEIYVSPQNRDSYIDTSWIRWWI